MAGLEFEPSWAGSRLSTPNHQASGVGGCRSQPRSVRKCSRGGTASPPRAREEAVVAGGFFHDSLLLSGNASLSWVCPVHSGPMCPVMTST